MNSDERLRRAITLWDKTLLHGGNIGHKDALRAVLDDAIEQDRGRIATALKACCICFEDGRRRWSACSYCHAARVAKNGGDDT